MLVLNARLVASKRRLGLLKYKWIRELRRQLRREIQARWEIEDALDDAQKKIVTLEQDKAELRNEVRVVDMSRPDGRPNAMQLEPARGYLYRRSKPYAANVNLAMLEWPAHLAVAHLAGFLARQQRAASSSTVESDG